MNKSKSKRRNVRKNKNNRYTQKRRRARIIKRSNKNRNKQKRDIHNRTLKKINRITLKGGIQSNIILDNKNVRDEFNTKLTQIMEVVNNKEKFDNNNAKRTIQFLNYVVDLFEKIKKDPKIKKKPVEILSTTDKRKLNKIVNTLDAKSKATDKNKLSDINKQTFNVVKGKINLLIGKEIKAANPVKPVTRGQRKATTTAKAPVTGAPKANTTKAPVKGDSKSMPVIKGTSTTAKPTTVKPGDKPKTTGESKATVKPGDKPGDKPKTTGESKSTVKPGDKPGDKPKTTGESKATVKPGDRPGDKPKTTGESKATVKPGDKPGDKPKTTGESKTLKDTATINKTKMTDRAKALLTTQKNKVTKSNKSLENELTKSFEKKLVPIMNSINEINDVELTKSEIEGTSGSYQKITSLKFKKYTISDSDKQKFYEGIKEYLIMINKLPAKYIKGLDREVKNNILYIIEQARIYRTILKEKDPTDEQFDKYIKTIVDPDIKGKLDKPSSRVKTNEKDRVINIQITLPEATYVSEFDKGQNNAASAIDKLKNAFN